MITSWNKFCFTTGYLEARVSLPTSCKTPGPWPGTLKSFLSFTLQLIDTWANLAVWTMGNLGRPGYMATTDGVFSNNEIH